MQLGLKTQLTGIVTGASRIATQLGRTLLGQKQPLPPHPDLDPYDVYIKSKGPDPLVADIQAALARGASAVPIVSRPFDAHLTTNAERLLQNRKLLISSSDVMSVLSQFLWGMQRFQEMGRVNDAGLIKSELSILMCQYSEELVKGIGRAASMGQRERQEGIEALVDMLSKLPDREIRYDRLVAIYESMAAAWEESTSESDPNTDRAYALREAGENYLLAARFTFGLERYIGASVYYRRAAMNLNDSAALMEEEQERRETLELAETAVMRELAVYRGHLDRDVFGELPEGIPVQLLPPLQFSAVLHPDVPSAPSRYWNAIFLLARIHYMSGDTGQALLLLQEAREMHRESIRHVDVRIAAGDFRIAREGELEGYSGLSRFERLRETYLLRMDEIDRLAAEFIGEAETEKVLRETG
jgi:tetratricopeptide (TPR) repeat protein